MLTKQNWGVIFLFSITCQAAAFAETLPPIGARLYEVETQTREHLEPVKIVPSHQRQRIKSGYMRDPRIPAPRVAMPKPAPQPKPQQPSFKESKLAFTALTVDGRYTKPRVNFADRRLPVDQAEERLDFNFLDRLLDSARRQEALLTSPAP